MASHLFVSMGPPETSCNGTALPPIITQNAKHNTLLSTGSRALDPMIPAASPNPPPPSSEQHPQRARLLQHQESQEATQQDPQRSQLTRRSP